MIESMMDTGYRIPSGRLAGRIAMVTGGSSGIGLAAVRAFAVAGADVVACGLPAAGAAELTARIGRETGRRVEWVAADVRRPDEVQAVADFIDAEFGHLEIVLSNAGAVLDGTVLETTEEQWNDMIDINLGGHFRVAKHTIPLIQRSGGGSLILVSSEHGLVATASRVAYCAAKGGVFNLTRALAIDCAPLGIRVNCLAPGAVRTPMSAASFAATGHADDAESAQTAPIPLRRMAEPEEIAAAALFLASNESSYMTGSTLLADGGVTTGYGE
jgi:meso-butanediol dehydrogenase/(S,S)-butanediol dehydrogenase/diacetyl reductase